MASGIVKSLKLEKEVESTKLDILKRMFIRSGDTKGKGKKAIFEVRGKRDCYFQRSIVESVSL